MPVITLNSIRGGSGTTSCAVGLAWALQTLDESVLIVDLSPSNLLHLHFNGKLNDHRGWAKGLLDSQKWHHNAFEYTPLLTYLPFGYLSVNERIKLKVLFEQNPLWWQQQVLRIASKKYRWIIFDKPQLDYWAEQPISIVSDCELCVLNADAACHALLHQDLLEHQVERSGSLRLNNLFEYISDKFSRNFKLIFSRSLFRSIDCQYPISLIRCLII